MTNEQVWRSLKDDGLEERMMQKTLVALSLAFFLLSSVVAAPVSAQAANDPKQPSVENPHMHFWGTGDLSSCWTHFDSNDSTGSSEEGYGERTYGSGQVEISLSCRMQDNLKEDMYLNPNGTILIEVGVNIFSGECENDQGNCQELTLTLRRGNLAVASQEFPAVSVDGDDEQIRWELPVDRNMTVWNKSIEEPTIDIEFSKPGYNGVGCGLLFDCTGSFRFYYSNNQEGMDAEVLWPVMNMTEVPSDGEGGDGEDGGSLPGGLPGFGLAAGLGSLALAAVGANSRINRN
ncbi:MAG: hypothetical protein VX959_02165 [Candidatus Thermoplasmatota archaeon]|nr:hypothetical protein [Candidatus Thermoplasmatota archaeon]